MEHGMERGTDVKCPNKHLMKVGVNWGWRERACACKTRVKGDGG